MDQCTDTSYADIARVRSGELLLLETQGPLLDLAWMPGVVATYWRTDGAPTSILWTLEENADIADALMWSRHAVVSDTITMSEQILVMALVLGYELTPDLSQDKDTAELRRLLSA